MGKKPRTPMPKKWIILLTIIIVIVIVGALLAFYKPPALNMEIKDIKKIDDDNFNLTVTFTTKDVNVTSDEYRIKITARRTVGEAETKKTLVEMPLEPVPPESTKDVVYPLTGVSGYTDLNIYVFKASKQILFRTHKIPIA